MRDWESDDVCLHTAMHRRSHRYEFGYLAPAAAPALTQIGRRRATAHFDDVSGASGSGIHCSSSSRAVRSCKRGRPAAPACCRICRKNCTSSVPSTDNGVCRGGRRQQPGENALAVHIFRSHASRECICGAPFRLTALVPSAAIRGRAAAGADAATMDTKDTLVLENLWIVATDPVCTHGSVTSIVHHMVAQSPAVATDMCQCCGRQH
jgi:hypothetical protein